MKAIVLSALLGLAASTSMVQWSYPKHSDLKYLIDKSFLGLGLYLELDAGYGSHYIGEEPGSIASNADLEAATYGFHLYTRLRGSGYIQLFGLYERLGEAEVDPVYWAPYQQRLEWTSLQSGDAFTLTTTAES